MKDIRLDLYGSEVDMNSGIWWLQRDVLTTTIHHTQTICLPTTAANDNND